MPTSTTPPLRTLEEQRAEFANSKLLASPLAGTIAWLAVGLAGLWLPLGITIWVLFIAVGCIAYLAMGISKLTGEDFLAKNKPPNTFNTLFFLTVGQALLVYSIAIPFFLQDYTSLPLSVGILTGLMWLPLSWIIGHWVGLFHAVTRTVGIVALWYAFPSLRFVTIPFAIVGIYLVSIVILMQRARRLRALQPA